jgi:hypothetical protein
MKKDTYIVSRIGETWSVTLDSRVTGTFSRRTDALLAAVICAGASGNLGHEVEVLAQSTTGETHLLWTNRDNVLLGDH